jgi:hypothetical protein
MFQEDQAHTFIVFRENILLKPRFCLYVVASISFVLSFEGMPLLEHKFEKSKVVTIIGCGIL